MDSIVQGDYVEGEEQGAWKDQGEEPQRGKDLGVCLRQGQITLHLSLAYTILSLAASSSLSWKGL